MFFNKSGGGVSGMTFTDRGDSTTPDYSVDDFTKNLNWYDKDISAIVGVGRRLVLIQLTTKPTVVTQQWSLRTKGNSFDQNRVFRLAMIANSVHTYDVWVWTDASGVIQYKISGGSWIQYSFYVRGFFS